MVNSIVLFLKCHGSESGNLIDNISSKLGKQVDVTDIQSNVKITLSSAASVSSYGTQVNKIFKKMTMKEAVGGNFLIYNYSDIDANLKKFIHLDTSEMELFTETFKKFIALDVLNNSKFKTLNDLFEFISQIEWDNEAFDRKAFIKKNLDMPNKMNDNDDDGTTGIYNYLFGKKKRQEIKDKNDKNNQYCDNIIFVFEVLHNIIISNKTVNFPVVDERLKLYLDDELSAINEMIQYYCIDNPTHRITDAMYYHCRLMIKDIFETSIEKEFSHDIKLHNAAKNMKYYDNNVETPNYIIFADPNNEKIVDVKIDQDSMDRHMTFKANPGEKENNRTYGIHVIKAYHNGNTFCAGVNSFTTEQFKDAGEDYSAAEKMKDQYMNNEQYLLSIKNPFFSEYFKR